MSRKATQISIKIFILAVMVLVQLSCAHTRPQPYNSFGEAAKQLNTPKLISDYQETYQKWASTTQGGGCGSVDIGVSLEGCAPSFIFDNKGLGNCGAFTTFAVHCLRKANYEAYPLYVHEKWPDTLAPGHQPRDYHIMALYKENGKWFTMDNGRARGHQGIKGPFNILKDLPYEIIRVDRVWKSE